MSLEMIGFEQNNKNKYTVPSVVFSSLGIINFTVSLVSMADMEDWKYVSIWYDKYSREIRFRKEEVLKRNVKAFRSRGKSKQLSAKTFIDKEMIEPNAYECIYDVVSKEIITTLKVKKEVEV